MIYTRLLAASTIVVLTAACSNESTNQDPDDTRGRTTYRVETLVAGGPMHGAKGMTFGPDGMLYVGSVLSQIIYRVNVKTGEVDTAVAAPDGEADDVAFAPDGLMVWTAMPSGEIRGRRADGTVFVVASDLPLINPVAFTSDGRLFGAQIGFDRLHEFDVTGKNPPRLVAKGIGHLNSFEITADDQLYGPLSGKGAVGRIDIETGVVTPVAENLAMLSAVNLDSNGHIYAIEWAGGQLLRIDAESGAVDVVTRLEPPLDNLAIGPDDTIFVSQPARSAIVSIDPDTGIQQELVPGNLSLPGGLAVTRREGHEALIVADDVGYRFVDTRSGAVSTTIDLADFQYPGSASDVAINDEVIVLTDVLRSRVVMVDRGSGETVNVWKDIESPYGVVLMNTGDPLVADFATGGIIRLKRTDKNSRDVIVDNLDGPVGIAWASADAIYVTEALGGTILRIDLNDASKVIVTDGLAQPEGLTVLADGSLAVVEVGARRVVTVDPITGTIDVLATDLPVGQFAPHTPAPVYVPSGIAVGAEGILFLTSDRDHSVLKLVPSKQAM